MNAGTQTYSQAGPHIDDIRLPWYFHQISRQVCGPEISHSYTSTDTFRSNLQSAFVSGMKEDLSLYGNVSLTSNIDHA